LKWEFGRNKEVVYAKQISHGIIDPRKTVCWRVLGKENLSNLWAPPIFGREKNKSCRQGR